MTEGDFVTWVGGEGVIEHLMVDGMLGAEGSEFAISATPDQPAALVRIYRNGSPTEMFVGKRVSELTVGREAREDRSAVTQVETRSENVLIDSVDFAQRIITVLAVPYEHPTQVPFRQEMWTEVFSRSAFNGIESQTRKIPATTSLSIPAPEHVGARLVGRVLSSDPYRDAGLVSEVKISRTAVGDETLELASDEALFPSIGFMIKNPKFDQELDQHTKTRRVNRAFLDHLAFVGQPAYEGAKVLAMRSEGSPQEQPQVSSTPRMNEFLSDPVLLWASERVRR